MSLEPLDIYSGVLEPFLLGETRYWYSFGAACLGVFRGIFLSYNVPQSRKCKAVLVERQASLLSSMSCSYLLVLNNIELRAERQLGGLLAP
jgi:hypothetical protein